jgi:hypothetical protein
MAKTHQETHVEAVSNDNPSLVDEIAETPEATIMGTVKILFQNQTVLVPTPSPDPNGK